MNRSVAGFECIGTGGYLAQYLIGPYYFGHGMKLADALLATVSAVGRVKENVSYCGGPTQAILMRADGTIQDMDFLEVQRIPQYSKEYEDQSRMLLNALYSADDDNFAVALKTFEYGAQALRARWGNDRRAIQKLLIDYPGEELPTNPEEQ